MNKVILVGRLTKEPDVKTSLSGTALCRYTLAVDRRFKKDGEQEADFIPCVAFSKSAEFAGKYFHKGTKIIVEGRLQTGSYEKDGVKHYTTDVIVEQQEFSESKAASAGNGTGAGAGTGTSTTADDNAGFTPVDVDASLETDEALPF